MRTLILYLVLATSVLALGTKLIVYHIHNPNTFTVNWNSTAAYGEDDPDVASGSITAGSTITANLTVHEHTGGWPSVNFYQEVAGAVPINDVSDPDAPPDLMRNNFSTGEVINYYYPTRDIYEYTPDPLHVYIELLDNSLLVWRKSPSGASYDEAGVVTQEVFREGIGKVVQAVAAGSGGGGGGGGSTDNSEEVNGQVLTVKGASPSTGNMSAASSNATAAYSSSFGTATANMTLTGNLTLTDPSGASSFWTVHFPDARGHTRDIDLDPSHGAHMDTIAAWCKLVLTVLAFIAFESWCWDEFKSYMVALTHSPQARGNTIVAGTGGQATGLIAAGILAVILTSFPAALVAIFGSTFDGIGRFATSEIMPTSETVFAQAFYLVNLFVPVAVLATMALQAFVVRKASLLVYGLASMAIKFVVP